MFFITELPGGFLSLSISLFLSLFRHLKHAFNYTVQERENKISKDDFKIQSRTIFELQIFPLVFF